jgi:ribosomal protein S27AE
MSKYISRSAGIIALAHRECGNDEYDIAVHDCIETLKQIPSADVSPVVKGRWIYDCDRVAADGWTYKQRHCSECGRQTLEADNFCPNCGADMRGKDGANG